MRRHNKVLAYSRTTKNTQPLFRIFCLDPRPDRTCCESSWKSPAASETESFVPDSPAVARHAL